MFVGRKDSVNTDSVALTTLYFMFIFNKLKFILFQFDNNIKIILTLSGGSLGSRIDEERSKAR